MSSDRIFSELTVFYLDSNAATHVYQFLESNYVWVFSCYVCYLHNKRYLQKSLS
jgi:hypothetical protein